MTKTDSIFKTYQDQIEGINKLNVGVVWTLDNLDAKAKALKTQRDLFDDLKVVSRQFDSQEHQQEEFEGGYQASMNEEEAFNVR